MVIANSDSTPIYRRSDVAAHTDIDKGIWVIYKDGIYDITTFVQNHPGGSDKIMLAAGKSVEPYWRLYRQHYNSSLPSDILKEMRIGTLHPDDVASLEADRDSSDPYAGDPDVSPVMNVLSAKPINAEAPASLISQDFITPEPLWFVRNHHPVPKIDPNAFRLTVRNKNGKAIKSYSLKDIQTKFKPTTITNTIQCGGNRRDEMNKVERTAGTPWSISAISNARFTGVRLVDVLFDAVNSSLSSSHGEETGSVLDALEAQHRHIIFTAEEGLQASIPISTAIDRRRDVLLAYDMNGEPLTASHGYPLRAVVPGTVGVRNVKWLTGIQLSIEEAEGPWQRGMAYKGFGPSTKSLDGIDVAAIPSLQEQPVTSAITVPSMGATIEPGKTTIRGYAYSGGGRGIVRVDVSIDGGKVWSKATLLDGSDQPRGRAWAWTHWEAEVNMPTPVSIELGEPDSDHKLRASATKKGPKKHRGMLPVEIICKATDDGYNAQPDSVKGIWNLRGINNNAWHRINVTVQEDDDDEEE